MRGFGGPVKIVQRPGPKVCAAMGSAPLTISGGVPCSEPSSGQRRFSCFSVGIRPLRRKRRVQQAVYRSYRDIPGVTSDDVEAIEALKKEYGVFVHGLNPSTEAFRKEDGSLRRLRGLFCGG